MTHTPRRLAVSPPAPKVRKVYANMGPHLPPFQGPIQGYTYSVGLPDFKPPTVPPNRMFDCDAASIDLAIKVCRAGDVIYVDPRVAVSDREIDGAMLDGIRMVIT